MGQILPERRTGRVSACAERKCYGIAPKPGRLPAP